MSDSIYHINNNAKPDNIEYVYYTCLGSHSSVDNLGNPVCEDKKNALAYTKKTNTDQQFYLKVGTYGKIFNPIGMYSEGKQNKFLSKIGKDEYVFQRVNVKVFEMYLNFLKTKNIAWLNLAEREMR